MTGSKRIGKRQHYRLFFETELAALAEILIVAFGITQF